MSLRCANISVVLRGVICDLQEPACASICDQHAEVSATPTPLLLYQAGKVLNNSSLGSFVTSIHYLGNFGSYCRWHGSTQSCLLHKLLDFLLHFAQQQAASEST